MCSFCSFPAPCIAHWAEVTPPTHTHTLNRDLGKAWEVEETRNTFPAGCFPALEVTLSVRKFSTYSLVVSRLYPEVFSG